MAIKAILLDIDGTLTNDEKKITPLTRDTLMKAQEMGIRLVIASGRPPKGLEQYGNLLDMAKHHGLFVCFNGSRVIDCESGEVLYDQSLDRDTFREILRHMKQFDVRPIVSREDHMLVEDVYNCMVKDGDREFNVIEYESRMNHYLLHEVPDLEQHMDGCDLNKILTAGDSDYLRAHFEEMAAPFKDRVSSMFTANFYYEFTALGVDKGAALTAAMNKLGIRPEECIGFGDAENDIPMLRYAGVGVAMANAQDKVKAMADEITDDNNHDGIAKMLMKYIPELNTQIH